MQIHNVIPTELCAPDALINREKQTDPSKSHHEQTQKQQQGQACAEPNGSGEKFTSHSADTALRWKRNQHFFWVWFGYIVAENTASSCRAVVGVRKGELLLGENPWE